MLKNKNSIIFIVNLACINGDENTVKYIIKEYTQGLFIFFTCLTFISLNFTYKNIF